MRSGIRPRSFVSAPHSLSKAGCSFGSVVNVRRLQPGKSCRASPIIVCCLFSIHTVESRLSEPFYPQEETITVDADIRGWLRAELCDVFGHKLEGYHLMDAVPVAGDNTAHVLRWQGSDTTRFRYDAVRLRFEYVDGEIYGIGF